MNSYTAAAFWEELTLAKKPPRAAQDVLFSVNFPADWSKWKQNKPLLENGGEHVVSPGRMKIKRFGITEFTHKKFSNF